MAFKYINGKIVPVKHKTVFGRLLGGISGISAKNEKKDNKPK